MIDLITNTDAIDKYRIVKLGKFSASSIHKLFVGGKRDMTPEELIIEKANGGKRKTVDTLFGDGATTYIRKTTKDAYVNKINEDEEVETKSIRIGKMKEPEAFRAYRDLMPKEYNFEHYGETNPVFKPHPLFPEDAGCTSDCVAYNALGAAWVSDFKCPLSSTHFGYLLDIKDGNDLREHCYDYWCQGQMNMICWNVDFFHWVSYHEDFPYEFQTHIVEIERDREWEAELNMRLIEAIKIKNQILNQLK